MMNTWIFSKCPTHPSYSLNFPLITLCPSLFLPSLRSKHVVWSTLLFSMFLLFFLPLTSLFSHVVFSSWFLFLYAQTYSYSFSKCLLYAYYVLYVLSIVLGFRLPKNNKTASKLTSTLVCILLGTDAVKIVHLWSYMTNEYRFLHDMPRSGVKCVW